MSLPFPDPAIAVSSRAEVFRSRLPSGWPPIELLKHVAHDELQRLEWGFEGRPVTGPWGEHPDGRWYVAADETPADLRVAPADAAIRRLAAMVGQDRLATANRFRAYVHEALRYAHGGRIPAARPVTTSRKRAE